MKNYSLYILIFFLSGCGTIFDSKPNQPDSEIINKRIETLQTDQVSEEPTINVEPTLIRPQLFLAMKESANFKKDIDTKQRLIFQNLEFILHKYDLKPVGDPAIWHTQIPNYFIVEAGVPLAKPLPSPETGTYYITTKRCKAVVVHFFGKRSLLPQAYQAMEEWLKDNKKQKVGNPWEILVSDSKVVKDITYLQTDVYCEIL